MATKRTDQQLATEPILEAVTPVDDQIVPPTDGETWDDVDTLLPNEQTEAIAREKLNVNSVDIAAILAQFDVGKLIEQQVAEQVAKANQQNKSNPIVDATERDAKVARPDRFLKHYRCDVSPDIQVLRRTYDPSQDQLTGGGKSGWIKFRRGHFFATDQRDVDQLEWMMRHNALDPTDSGRVIGGNPTIYEDDGRDLVACIHCGEPFVAGSNALKSHLRATHGVVA